MFFHKLLSLSPKISVPAFFLFVILGAAFRFLVGSIPGALVLSLGLWFLSPVFLDIDPLTPGELLVQVSDLPQLLKIAVASSTVTVIGFLVSFHVGTSNWRNKMQAELRLSAASELEGFFSELQPHLNALTYAAEAALSIVRDIHSATPSPDLAFRVKYWLEQVPKVIEARSQVSAVCVNVHRFTGKYFVLFNNIWGASASFEKARDALTEISRVIWIRFPVISPADPAAPLLFVRSIDAASYEHLLEVAERESAVLYAFSGALRGQLIAPITGMTGAGVIQLILQRRSFSAAMDAIHRAQRAHD